MMQKPLNISIGLFIVLDVVTTIFVIQKLYFDQSLVLPTPSQAAIEYNKMIEPEEPIEEGAAPDDIFITNFVSTSEVAEDGILKLKGLITIHNEQQVGAEGVIVTFQLVDNSGPEIIQAVTDENGDGEFSFDVVPGSWRVEVLDLTGEGFAYDKSYNVIDVYTGRFQL